MKIETEMDITRERIADLLCCGMEGGVDYWARRVRYVKPPEDADVLNIGGHWNDGDGTIYRHIHYPMCEAGGGVFLADADFAHLLNDAEGEDEYDSDASFPPTLLDWVALQRGLQIMATKFPHHFGNFISEDDDAETGDVFVQCAVLGDVVFG
jgi:hypothetical protein